MSTAIDGILLLNKAQGFSSNAVLQRTKRLFQAKKAGHTGSLDPLATGMLPICFGEATKFSQYLLDADKAYEVSAVLGITTDTGDSDGTIIATQDVPLIRQETLDACLNKLTGPIEQVPPMYSALKHKGRALYTYARRGEVIERKARPVTIYEINCLEFNGNTIRLSVKCSKGTYIRSLIESIGEALGVGAHVTALHRTYTAGFESEPMYCFEDLIAHCEAKGPLACEAYLLPVERAVIHFPVLAVSAEEVLLLQQGRVVTRTERLPLGVVRLHAPNQAFMGLGECFDGGVLKAKRLLSTN